MDLLIRQVGVEDTQQIVAFFDEVAAADPTVAAITRESWIRFIEQEVNEGLRGFRLALHGPQVVGLATSSMRRSGPDPVRHFRIIVHPDNRRRGIGTELLHALCGLDESTPRTLLQCLCPESAAHGRNFIEGHGFALVESEVQMLWSGATPIERDIDVDVPVVKEREPVSCANAVAQIHNRAYRGDLSFVECSVAWMKTLLEREAELYTARIGGEVVGFCHAEAGRTATWIESVAVDPSHQGRGIGKRLVVAVLADAGSRRQGARLQVSDRNVAAFALYGRMGFAVVGRDLRYRAERISVVGRLEGRR